MRWVLAFLLAVAGAGVGIAFALPIFNLVHTNFDSALREALNGSVGFVYLAILTLIPAGGAFAGGFLGYKLGKKPAKPDSGAE